MLWGTAELRVERMSKIRVLLADDHDTVLERVRTVLGNEFEIVGAVNNGRDAVAQTERLNPDVLVIDISMPVLDGLKAVCQLRSKRLNTKFVFFTVHEDEDFVAAAFSAGASAYVSKLRVTTDLVPAIHAVIAGNTYISQPMTR
jgi:DNA-binding NarL/FixJ family response regulator